MVELYDEMIIIAFANNIQQLTPLAYRYISMTSPSSSYIVIAMIINMDIDSDDDIYEQFKSAICRAAEPLRAEQGPCEPSEDVVRKFGEQ